MEVKPNASETQAHEIQKLKKEVIEKGTELHQMELEREFYFSKLQRIEEYCQENEKNEALEVVLNILYEPDEEHGFIAPEEIIEE